MLTWENCVEAQALRTKGWSISAIANHLGHDRKTIRAYLNGDRRPRRYRPGRPYGFAPVWFLSAPERLDEARTDAGQGHEITGGTHGRAIESGAVETGAPPVPQGATGGASDRW